MSNGNIQYDRIDEVVLADIRRRQTKLQRELAELDAVEQAIRTTSDYRRQAFERIRSEVDMQPLSPQETRDATDRPKSQRAVLRLIAERNQGWLVVQPAIKLMVDAGVFVEASAASAQVYTVLRQNKNEFEPIVPGIYRLLETGDEGLAKPPRKVEASTGLVDKVAGIIAMHPNWKPKEICAELLRQAWDFGDKRPIFAVGMAYANLAKRRKAETVQAPRRLRSVS